jgi:hypothetical protein
MDNHVSYRLSIAGVLAVCVALLALAGCGGSTGNTAMLLSQAEELATGDATDLLRKLVHANNDLVREKLEGTDATRERALATFEEQHRAFELRKKEVLALYAKCEKRDPKNAAVYLARGRMRWRWLVASIDMHDEGDGRVRRERTEEVNRVLADLDKVVELAPDDPAPLLLRGRVVLLDWVEVGMDFLDRPDRLGELGFERVGGIGYSLGAIDGPEGMLPGCDRAIADFTKAIALGSGDPEGYLWRATAFSHKCIITYRRFAWEKPDNWQDRMREAVRDDLDQAQQNIQHARFLSPQDEKLKELEGKIADIEVRIRSAGPYVTKAIPLEVTFRVSTPQKVFTRAAPAVVRLEVKLDGGTASGSGFFVDSRGLILTNKHVIQGGRNIKATLKDGRRFAVGVVAVHERYDLALVRLQGLSGEVSALPFSYIEPQIGEDIIMIGHPQGMDWTLTAGKISQIRGSEIEPNRNVYVQTDAPSNPGNSGGPLVSLRGQVVGVLTMKLRASEGLAFGIHYSVAQEFVNRYR